MPVRTTVESLDHHKVKLHVEVDASTFDQAVEDASRKLASEVRIPGFRRGKVPRRLLEARLGTEALREQALKEAIPGYYQEALRAESIDAVSVPEIENVSTEKGAAVSFDAVVDVRPQVDLGDWKAEVSVTVPDLEATEEEVDGQIGRLREQFAELEAVGRPAAEGDFATIDIRGYVHSEEVPGTTATDLLYQVGSGEIVPRLDADLTGSRVGDILKFNDALPEAFGDRAGEEVSFQVLVKEVSARRLSEVTDEWVQEVSEFETVDELRADVAERITSVRKVEAALTARQRIIDALVERVTDDPPDSMVDHERERLLERFVAGLRQQKVDLKDYLQATGETEDALIEAMRARAVRAVKAELAFQAIGEAESLEASDEEINAEVARLAERAGKKPADLRRALLRSGALDVVRSDIVKRAALEFAVRSVEIRSESGTVLDLDQLVQPPEAGSLAVSVDEPSNGARSGPDGSLEASEEDPSE